MQYSMQPSTANDKSNMLCLAITSTIFSTSVGNSDITLWSACMSEAEGLHWGMWATLDG